MTLTLVWLPGLHLNTYSAQRRDDGRTRLQSGWVLARPIICMSSISAPRGPAPCSTTRPTHWASTPRLPGELWAVSCNCWKVSYKLQYWAMVRMMAKQLCGAGAGSDQSALVQQLRQYGGVTRLDSYFCCPLPISISGHTLYLPLRPSNCSPTGPRPGCQPWIWSWLTPRWGCRPLSSSSCPTSSRRPSLGEDNFECTCYYIVNYI